MKTRSSALAGALLMSTAGLAPHAFAQTPCVTQNFVVPPGANTGDKAAPFFVDTTGLDFKTQPRTRDPKNPNYPRATELADGMLPIRYWFEMGDQDLFYPNPTIPDGMHDWTLSAALMAKVLAAKGYHYQFVFARNAKHVDRPTVAQTMPAALEWLWKGYPIP